ncbi:GNAT family N-acetyltransferase [Streptomyces yunnanensis]|uniref:GNAT family N-acetyltransferase n=1 Tax=Streptomyces yunnanensis TaxID=156453 RepID=A0ABY8A085_9ACTN|nr:GNAT family N-acetyltransferase [Streptomyces yunnanensis]WEB38300.1 GNAT family N-acetyltransferase [Streptomyces yunnanensis]
MSLSTEPCIPAGSLSSGARQPTLLTSDGGLLLRPWAGDDAVALHRAFEDTTIQYWSLRRMTSRAEAEEWIAAAHRQWREERGAQWAVVPADGGEILGRLALRSMDR